MNPLASRSFIALLLVTCFSFAAARTSVDGKVRFPANDPTFTVEFPSSWTYEADKDGNLDCDPGDGSDYTLSILLLKDIKTEKELKALVPKLADSMASGAKIKNFEAGDIESSTNGNGIRFTGIRGEGKTEGTDFVVLVHAFEAKKGRFYAIVTAGSKKADAKQEKAYDEITASIEAIAK